MATEVLTKQFPNGDKYIHSLFSGTIEPAEVMKRVVENMVQGYRDKRTLILSDWSAVDQILFDEEEIQTIASITSTVDLLEKKIYIAIYSGENTDIKRQAENFIKANANQQIFSRLFHQKQDALDWLQANCAD